MRRQGDGPTGLHREWTFGGPTEGISAGGQATFSWYSSSFMLTSFDTPPTSMVMP